MQILLPITAKSRLFKYRSVEHDRRHTLGFSNFWFIRIIELMKWEQPRITDLGFFCIERTEHKGGNLKCDRNNNKYLKKLFRKHNYQFWRWHLDCDFIIGENVQIQKQCNNLFCTFFCSSQKIINKFLFLRKKFS
jgi:hypothetical protein